MHAKRSLRNQQTERPLDPTWFPCPNTVLIGRGRKALENPGNIRFREVLTQYLDSYASARKARKSSIIKSMIGSIRAISKDGIGFVKQDPSTGWFIAVSDQHAKVWIAQTFRDNVMIDTYKSNKHFKQFKRDCDRQNKQGTFEEFTKKLAAGSIEVRAPPADAVSNQVTDEEDCSEQSWHEQQSKEGGDFSFEPIPLSQAMEFTFDNNVDPAVGQLQVDDNHKHVHHHHHEQEPVETPYCQDCNEEEKVEFELLHSCGGCDDFLSCPKCSRLEGRPQYEGYLVSPTVVRDRFLGAEEALPKFAEI